MENGRQVLQKIEFLETYLNLFSNIKLIIKVNDIFYGIIKISNEKN